MQELKSPCEPGDNREQYLGLRGELASPGEELGPGKVAEMSSCKRASLLLWWEELLLLGKDGSQLQLCL